MRAAQLLNYNGKDSIQIVDDALRPKPEPGQVLVEVYAAAANPFDWKLREGRMKDSIPLKLPATLGGDCAGVVAEIGSDVQGFQAGQTVYGQANAVSGKGSFAEFTAVKAESLASKPKSVDYITAAALPLAGVSAYMALVEHIDVQRGQKILIHGGAGGIGSFAVQLANHLGAHVITTVAAEDKDYVKSLGAAEAIDYKTEAFETIVKDLDAVFDTVGGPSYEKSYCLLRPGGVIVSMVAKPNEDLARELRIQAVMQQTRMNPERLAKLAELVDDGALKVHIDKTFPLDQADEALEYLKQGQHRGKVVIKIRD